MAVHTLVKIVIPLYRLPLSQAEETAIKHTARILQSYPICFIIPEGLPKAPLERLIPQAEIMSVSNHWLGRENGISGYNDMMMSKDFYSLFADTNIFWFANPTHGYSETNWKSGAGKVTITSALHGYVPKNTTGSCPNCG